MMILFRQVGAPCPILISTLPDLKRSRMRFTMAAVSSGMSAVPVMRRS